MAGVLSTFGVSQDAERLYRGVLRASGRRLEQHCRRLGWPEERAQTALSELLAVQLVVQESAEAGSAPDWNAAADPTATMACVMSLTPSWRSTWVFVMSPCTAWDTRSV